MSTAYKPEEYTSVSVYLVVSGAQKVINFLRATFGAVPLRRFDNQNGTIMHAEVRIDDTIVMIADSNIQWPAHPGHVHVYVPNVDMTYQRALDAGGVSIQEPEQRSGDPDRRGGVKDPTGNTWWISTQQS